MEVQAGEGHPRVVLPRTVVAGAAGAGAGAAVSRHVVDDRVNIDATYSGKYVSTVC